MASLLAHIGEFRNRGGAGITRRLAYFHVPLPEFSKFCHRIYEQEYIWINQYPLIHSRGHRYACDQTVFIAPYVWEGKLLSMMTSSNGSIFRVTGHLCGKFTGPGEFPAQRPVTRNFDVFFDLRLIKQLSKQSRGGSFETLSHPL